MIRFTDSLSTKNQPLSDIPEKPVIPFLPLATVPLALLPFGVTVLFGQIPVTSVFQTRDYPETIFDTRSDRHIYVQCLRIG